MDEDGYAHFSAIENLSARARVTVTECQDAVTALLSPDHNSADPEFDGRRIERVPGGFMILNALKYRNNFNSATRREQTRLRVQKHRAKKAGIAISGTNDKCVYCGETATGPDHVIPISAGGQDNNSNCVLSCTRCNRHKGSQELVNFLNDKGLPFHFDVKSIIENPVLGNLVSFTGSAFVTRRNATPSNVTHPYEYASVHAPDLVLGDAKGETTAEEIYELYPHKVGKPSALRAIQNALKTYDSALLKQKTADYATAVKGTPRMIPHPSTWFNEERFNDDSSTWVTNGAKIESFFELGKKSEAKKARMAELKRKHFSEVQSISAGTYLAAGWRDAKAKEEYFRLKTETETLNQQLSKA